jgi:hypothetical protein
VNWWEKETPLVAAIAAFASRTVINASFPKIFPKKFLRILVYGADCMFLVSFAFLIHQSTVE